MTLFNDTELFNSGLAGKKVFDLPDTELILIDNFFSKEESDHYYNTLLAQTRWQEYEMPMYDKVVIAPRMIWDKRCSARCQQCSLVHDVFSFEDFWSMTKVVLLCISAISHVFRVTVQRF